MIDEGARPRLYYRRNWPRELRIVVVLAAALFIVAFWRLGVPTFWDPDEAHYAETSREMMASGDVWAPYYNEEPFFDKPVLFHQLQAIAMRLVDDPELAARLVPALAALALVAVTVWFGAAMVSRDVGWLAGLMLAMNPGTFGLARYAILDTLFTLATFGGCACLGVAAARDRPSLQWLGYVALAVGVLVKGPLAIVLAGLTLLLLIAVSADLRSRLLALRWVVGLLLIAVIAAPWFVYMWLRFRHDFVVGYILDENLRLFASNRFGNKPDYGFYFRILGVGMLPWTGLLVGRFVDGVRATISGERMDLTELMLWTWAGTIVGFFTLSTFKLDHYVFTAAPALCLLSARAWYDARGARGDAARRHTATRIGVHTIGPCLLVLGVALGYMGMTRLALPAAAMIVPLVLAACGFAFTALTYSRREATPGLPWLVIVPLIVTYAGLILFALPRLEEGKVIPDIARWAAEHAQPFDRIGSYRLNRWTPAYRFYVARHVTFLEDAAQAEAFFGAPEPFYCAMRRDAYDALVAQGIPLRIVYEREGMSATSGRALWRTSTPLTRFVVVSNARR